ncbi:hypothetical protein CDAR_457271 [Caerostris darwini]|uniref:Uncharacterized protein n=1 Tax=Caerostris darwini TaxID=1538125 RepID=A0AAV4PEI9_9ARAC|nr:hypothetical protein CDAR_457271 [Caerostris darwini]
MSLRSSDDNAHCCHRIIINTKSPLAGGENSQQKRSNLFRGMFVDVLGGNCISRAGKVGSQVPVQCVEGDGKEEQQGLDPVGEGGGGAFGWVSPFTPAKGDQVVRQQGFICRILPHQVSGEPCEGSGCRIWPALPRFGKVLAKGN